MRNGSHAYRGLQMLCQHLRHTCLRSSRHLQMYRFTPDAAVRPSQQAGTQTTPDGAPADSSRLLAGTLHACACGSAGAGAGGLHALDAGAAGGAGGSMRPERLLWEEADAAARCSAWLCSQWLLNGKCAALFTSLGYQLILGRAVFMLCRTFAEL